jgi:S-adenosylmethionine decarboxylase
MNRDHWLLYLTSPNAQPVLSPDTSLDNGRLSLPSPGLPPSYQDTTLEILMSHLEPAGRLPFFHGESHIPNTRTGHELGASLSSSLGIDKLFSAEETRLDSFGFEPCGYSANAVIGSGLPHTKDGQPGGGYYTIHVTPEEGWSYASFECNVPLPSGSGTKRPDLPTLIRNVVGIFQPNRLSITLFVSTSVEDGAPTSDMEQKAWSAFGTDILGKGYERKDRIGYEFDGYDLVFACFERKGWVEPKQQITI